MGCYRRYLAKVEVSSWFRQYFCPKPQEGFPTAGAWGVKTRFRESFAEDLSALTDAGLLQQIRRAIEQVEAAQTFQEIPHLKRLEANGKYYRIRLRNHRRGFVCEDSAVTSVRCLDRKEICRHFP